MRASHSPMVLWDYVIELLSLIQNIIPHMMFQNNVLTPHEVTLGEPTDISNLCFYGWYVWTYYCDHDDFPDNRDKLGTVLVPIKNEWNQMDQSILKSKCTVVTRQTLIKLQKPELIC